MTTETSGLRVLDAFATEGASIPVIVIDGLFQMRLRIVPAPTGETPAGRPASSRSVSSLYGGVSASRSVSPSTATAPLSSHSVDSSVTVATVPAFCRYCRKVIDGAYLIGVEFGIQASVMLALGVVAKDLAEGDEIEDQRPLTGEFVDPKALIDSDAA